jgi:acetoin utilization protein AcuB
LLCLSNIKHWRDYCVLLNMLCIELISNEIAPLKLTDTGLRALSLMEEFKVNQLPVIDGDKYVGLFSEDDIFNFNSPDETIAEYQIEYNTLKLFPHNHVFDALRLSVETNLSIIPIVDEEGNYIGCVSLKSLINNLSQIASVQDFGAILILEMQKRDYNLSQLAQIFESENIKILSLFIKSHPDSTTIDVIIKLNSAEINSSLRTLERYNYMVKHKFNTSDKEDNLRDRYDLLMSYLDS